MSIRTRHVLRLRFFALCFFAAWILLTLYPNPLDLAKSVYRVFNPPINASLPIALEEHFADLTEAPAIDRRVQSNFPYQYDWVTYSLPWYFPTIDEAFANMAGDCKTRLVVLASLLESRGIPYSIAVSPTHVWVEYEGKVSNRIENTEVALFTSAGDGAIALPARFEWRRSFDSFWTAFWTYMPIDRKLTLVAGLFFTIALLLLAGVRPADSRGRPAVDVRTAIAPALSGSVICRFQAPFVAE